MRYLHSPAGHAGYRLPPDRPHHLYAGAGGQPRLRFLAWLTVASAICAYLGAVAAWGLFILLCPGGLGLFEARQSLPGLILLALLAAETLRIVLERLIERFGNPS